MGISYQDIDTRLRVIEDKVNFFMDAFTITKKYPSTLVPGEIVSETMSMAQAYRELKASGAGYKPATTSDEQRTGQETV